MKRPIKWALGAVVGVLVALLVGAGALYGWAQTDSGRQWLSVRVTAALGEGESQIVSIGALRGNVFARFEIDDLTARDASGAWLEVDRLEIDWSPWALLDGVVHLKDAAARGVALHRLPPADPNAPPEWLIPLMGWGMVGVTVILGLLQAVGGILAAMTARYIATRRYRMFCLVVAGLACLSVPLGTALGVYTFVILTRPDVIELFAQMARLRSRPRRAASNQKMTGSTLTNGRSSQ